MKLRERKQLIQLEECAWLLGSDEIDNQFHSPFLISVASDSFSINKRSPRGRSEGGKNARARQSGQLVRLPDFRNQPHARRISFAVLGTCHFDFSVKIFFCATKNKVQFFSCRFSRWFLLSSPLAGQNGRR